MDFKLKGSKKHKNPYSWGPGLGGGNLLKENPQQKKNETEEHLVIDKKKTQGPLSPEK